MQIWQLLFSFEGRINRATWWLTWLAVVACIFMPWLFLRVAESSLGIAAIVFQLILLLPVMWIQLALSAKRLHDLDRSAWWLLVFYALPATLQGIADHAGALHLLFFLPSVAFIFWGIVELGFLSGTYGPNHYGPDPLQRA